MDHQAHLDRDALLRASYGSGEEGHLAECPACAAAVAELAARRGAAAALPELPEYFWQRQQAAIMAATRTSRHHRFQRWAAVLATAVLLAVGAISVAVRPAPAPVFSESDQALWREAQESSTRLVPQGLEPVRQLLPPDIKEIH